MGHPVYWRWSMGRKLFFALFFLSTRTIDPFSSKNSFTRTINIKKSLLCLEINLQISYFAWSVVCCQCCHVLYILWMCKRKNKPRFFWYKMYLIYNQYKVFIIKSFYIIKIFMYYVYLYIFFSTKIFCIFCFKYSQFYINKYINKYQIKYFKNIALFLLVTASFYFMQ